MATRIDWRFWEHKKDNCAAIEPLLSLFADDMASEAEARRVTAHLPSCERCRHSLQWMQATRQVIVSRPVVAPPADLCARISRAIAESESPRVPVRPASRLLTLRPALGYGFSVALLVALGGGVLWNEAHQPLVPHQVQRTVVATNPSSGHQLLTPAAKPKRVQSILPSASVVANRNTPSQAPTLVHHAVVTHERPDLTAMAASGTRSTPAKVTFFQSAPHPVVVHHVVTTSSETLLANRTHPTPLPTLRVKTLRPSPAPQENTQIASLPPPVAPPSVRVLPPTVTPDQVHVASLTASPSLNDTLHSIAVSFNKAKIISSSFVANRNTIADTVAVATADSSGTATITHGPVR
jgi:hypothetical protein